MRVLMILPIAALLASCAGQPSASQIKFAATEEARLEKDLAGYVPEKPRNCISLREAEGVESYGDTTLLFRQGRNLIYRNDTRGSCPGIGDDNILVNQVYGSQLCQGDISRVIERTGGFYAGSCSLGQFVPYRRLPKG
jgi:hypothetical protein